MIPKSASQNFRNDPCSLSPNQASLGSLGCAGLLSGGWFDAVQEMTATRPCLLGHGSALARDSSNVYAMGLTAAAKCQCDSHKQATWCYARNRQATTPSWGARKEENMAMLIYYKVQHTDLFQPSWSSTVFIFATSGVSSGCGLSQDQQGQSLV